MQNSILFFQLHLFLLEMEYYFIHMTSMLVRHSVRQIFVNFFECMRSYFGKVNTNFGFRRLNFFWSIVVTLFFNDTPQKIMLNYLWCVARKYSDNNIDSFFENIRRNVPFQPSCWSQITFTKKKKTKQKKIAYRNAIGVFVDRNGCAFFIHCQRNHTSALQAVSNSYSVTPRVCFLSPIYCNFAY